MDNGRHGYEPVIPLSFTARFILFVILASYGIQNILSNYRYWFIIVTQRGLDPLWNSPWRQLADLLMSISSLGMIVLGIDLISTEALRNRHRKGLTIVLLIRGASRIISNFFVDAYLFSHGGLRHFDLMDIIPYVWGVGFLYIGYRLNAKKPEIVRSIVIVTSVVFGAELIRQLFLANQVLDLHEFQLQYIAHFFMQTLATLSAFIFSVNGIRGNWSVETLLKRGIPWYLKAGITFFGINVLVITVWILLTDPESLMPLARDQVSLLIMSLSIIHGLSLALTAIYPWKTLRNTALSNPHEKAIKSG